MKRPLLFAHRGFSGIYPENSPLAFRMAAEKTNADGIESDVHLSKDGQLVIFHDASVERTSNGTGFIRDLTNCWSWTSAPGSPRNLPASTSGPWGSCWTSAGRPGCS